MAFFSLIVKFLNINLQYWGEHNFCLFVLQKSKREHFEALQIEIDEKKKQINAIKSQRAEQEPEINQVYLLQLNSKP